MKRVALSLALCALVTGPVAGQDKSFEVSTPTGTYKMTVQIIEGVGDKVALAAEEEADESHSVMVMRLPGTEYVLRTEQSGSSDDVTWMLDASSGDSKPVFADSVCTTRWNMGDKGTHQFISVMSEDEELSDWAWRHSDGLMMISTVYPASGRLSGARQSQKASRQDRAQTSWMDADGMQHEVSTKQHEGEADDAFMARHRSAVQAFAEVVQPKS